MASVADNREASAALDRWAEYRSKEAAADRPERNHNITMKHSSTNRIAACKWLAADAVSAAAAAAAPMSRCADAVIPRRVYLVNDVRCLGEFFGQRNAPVIRGKLMHLAI